MSNKAKFTTNNATSVTRAATSIPARSLGPQKHTNTSHHIFTSFKQKHICTFISLKTESKACIDLGASRRLPSLYPKDAGEPEARSAFATFRPTHRTYRAIVKSCGSIQSHTVVTCVPNSQAARSQSLSSPSRLEPIVHLAQSSAHLHTRSKRVTRRCGTSGRGWERVRAGAGRGVAGLRW